MNISNLEDNKESPSTSTMVSPFKKMKYENSKTDSVIESVTESVANEINENTKKSNKKEIKNRCIFTIIRKGRNCNQLIKKGETYCVEHSYMDKDVSNGRKRILCPLDDKHSCFEDSLKSHLKRCNARAPDDAPGYVKGINYGPKECEIKKITLRDANSQDIYKLIEKIKHIYKTEKLDEIETEIKSHISMKDEMEDKKYGNVSLRHIMQQTSLLGHMESLNFLTDDKCFIEFGAGKGGLSHYVQKATEQCKGMKFVLVDRGSNRYKKDGHHRCEGPTFERIKMDIGDLDLGKHPCMMNNKNPIVSIGKHLCGVATDLMLRCLVNSAKNKETNEDYLHVNFAGIVLALCCHHECDWRSYVGQSTLLDWGFSGHEFYIMRCMSSWAVCGTPDDEHNKPEVPKLNRFSDIKAAERTHIGEMCKHIINKGRLNYLKENGFDAKTLIYADKVNSLENVVLIATKNQ